MAHPRNSPNKHTVGLLKAELGLEIVKADEMECLVAGCNFLLQAIQHEAFTYLDDETKYININGMRGCRA